LFRRISTGLDEFRGIPPEANRLIYASFFNWAAAGLLWITLQIYLVLEGLSFATSGIILTIIGITSASSTLLFGGLADRYGRKRFVVLGGIIASFTLVLFALVGTNVPLLVGTAVLSGLSEAMYASSWGAMLADKATDAKRTSAFSLSFFIATISAAVGGFSASILGLLKNSYAIDLVTGHRYLFLGVALLSLLGPGIALTVSESKSSATDHRGFHIIPKRSRKTVEYSLAGILIALGAGMVIPLMPGWALLKFGIVDDVSAPILGGINSLVMGFANLAAPRLARRFGTVKTIVLTQGSSTAFLFSLPFSPNFASASSIYVVRSALMMMSNPVEQSLLIGLVPPEERSQASAVTASLWRLPNSLSTSVGAYFMGLGGALYLALPFFLCTALYLTSISYFWSVFKKIRLPEEEELVVAVPTAT
jgi:MFS family permease